MQKAVIFFLIFIFTIVKINSQTADELYQQANDCAQLLREKTAEYQQLVNEYQQRVQEVRRARFCSECLRPASQIEQETGETFEAHLARVHGHVVYSQELIMQAKKQLDDEYLPKLQTMWNEIQTLNRDCQGLYQASHYAAQDEFIANSLQSISNGIIEFQNLKDYIDQTTPSYLNEDFESNTDYYEQMADQVDNEDVAKNIIGDDVDDDPYSHWDVGDVKITRYESVWDTASNKSGWDEQGNIDISDWDPMETVTSNQNADYEDAGEDALNTSISISYQDFAQNNDINKIDDEISENNIETINPDNQNLEANQPNNINEYQNQINEQYVKNDNENIEKYSNQIAQNTQETYQNFNDLMGYPKEIAQQAQAYDPQENKQQETNDVAVEVSVENDDESYVDAAKNYIEQKWNYIKDVTTSSIPKSIFGLKDYYDKTLNRVSEAVDILSNPDATDQDYDRASKKTMETAEEIKNNNFGSIFD